MDVTLRITAPKWVGRISAALVGWNVGVLTAFMTVICMVFLTESIGVAIRGNAAIAVGSVAIILGILTALLVGWIMTPWFLRKPRGRAYAWLVVLVAITVITMPGPFVYVDG